jgi:hypothetical protein
LPHQRRHSRPLVGARAWGLIAQPRTVTPPARRRPLHAHPVHDPCSREGDAAIVARRREGVDKRREKYPKKNREGNAINGFAAMAGANPFIIRGTKCAAGRQSRVSRRRCRSARRSPRRHSSVAAKITAGHRAPA